MQTRWSEVSHPNHFSLINLNIFLSISIEPCSIFMTLVPSVDAFCFTYPDIYHIVQLVPWNPSKQRVPIGYYLIRYYMLWCVKPL